MTRHSVLRPPSSMNRRQPLLAATKSTSSVCGSARFAEVAGGTVAECAAVCCCCPCGLVNLLVLAVYKLPAGLCRKALRRHRRERLMKKGLLPPRRSRRCDCGCDDTELQIHPISVGLSPATAEKAAAITSLASDQDVLDLEKEMWERFYGTGFWRSPSQKEPIISTAAAAITSI